MAAADARLRVIACDISPEMLRRAESSDLAAAVEWVQLDLGWRTLPFEADTFDAITSDRPYRAAQSIPAGRREIERHSGRQFDPEIVHTFLSISEKIWEDLRYEIEVQSPR